MELGYQFAVFLQTLLRWILLPYYWIKSRREKKLLPPISDPILKLSAATLSGKLRRREITSKQIVTAYIRRICEVNPVINAVVEERFEEALKDAEQIDQYLAQNVLNEDHIKANQPLLGIPVTIKESCSLKGLSYCVGSKKRIGLKAAEDGEAVLKLKRAGAIPLLVSNTPELCLGWESNNLVTGRTCNPYNTNLSSGGSSGGEGALLASGASIVGIGSDVAGSIRVPAMFNGIFGHKPTPRVISIVGHHPSSKDQRVLDYLVIGPMARYAEDLELMMKVMVDDSANSLRLDSDVDLGKVNVYFMETAGRYKVEDEIMMVIKKCVTHLREKCGSNVQDFKFDMKTTCEMSISLFYNIEDIPSVLQDPVNGEIGNNVCVEFVKRIFGMSKYSLGGIFFHMLQKTRLLIPKFRNDFYQSQADGLREDFLKRLGDDGIFLYPTFPCPAFQHNKIYTLTTGIMYTMIFNILGFPCTHVPLGTNSSGLPIGLQVIAAPFQDRLCFAIAKELEKCFGGWREPPA